MIFFNLKDCTLTPRMTTPNHKNLSFTTIRLQQHSLKGIGMSCKRQHSRLLDSNWLLLWLWPAHAGWTGLSLSATSGLDTATLILGYMCPLSLLTIPLNPSDKTHLWLRDLFKRTKNCQGSPWHEVRSYREGCARASKTRCPSKLDMAGSLAIGTI